MSTTTTTATNTPTAPNTFHVSLPVMEHSGKLWAVVNHHILGEDFKKVFVTLSRQDEASITLEISEEMSAEVLRSDNHVCFAFNPPSARSAKKTAKPSTAGMLPVLGKAWERIADREYCLEFEGLEYNIADDWSKKPRSPGWTVWVCGGSLEWDSWITFTDTLTLDESQAGFWHTPQQAAAAARRFAASRKVTTTDRRDAASLPEER